MLPKYRRFILSTLFEKGIMVSVDELKFKRAVDWYTRRDQTMESHLAAEAAHDVDAIMATYAPEAEVIVNGQVFGTLEQIRNFHLALGFGGKGALPDLSSPPLRSFKTGEVIVIEYCIKGTHEGEFVGIQPTGKKVEMAAMVIYEFDDDAMLKSERAYIDITPLLPQG
jgi:predicted ester cyclase